MPSIEQKHHWVSQDGHFAVIEICSSVNLCFEDAHAQSVLSGPHRALRVIGGYLWTGEKFRTLLAAIDDPSGKWKVIDSDTLMASARVLPHDES